MAGTPRKDLQKRLTSLVGLVIVFLIIILINVLLSFANVRWDVTEERIYSLSPETQKILASVSVPVTIKFFYSRSNKNLPNELKLYARRVREFLTEYQRAGKGKIRVQDFDPRPDTDEEDWAQRYGLKPIELRSGDKIYCGLVFAAADQEEVIPFVDPAREELLEYDITRNISRVQSAKKKTIGIMSTLPVFGVPTNRATQMPSPPWLFVSELKKTYKVKNISISTTKIDDDVDLLIIIHPKNLGEKALYAIDQFVLSGKNAIVFVDPYCIIDRPQRVSGFVPPSWSNLERLFKAWGVKMDPSKVVVDMDQPTALRTMDNRIIRNPLWITARHETFSKVDVVTSKLHKLLFPIAGALEKDAGSKYGFEPLVQTSKDAALIESFKASFGVEAIRREFSRASRPFTLIARITGKFKTAFPSGPPTQKDGKGKASKAGVKGAQIREASKECNIIAVCDADMLADKFYVQKQNVLGLVFTKMFNDNLNFVSNACEVLTGSDILIGIRSRSRYERPFTKVLELERRARQRWLSKEQELARQAEETNQKLRELEKQKDPSQKVLISPEQRREIAKFRDRRRRINKELREVRKNLRADIDTLGMRLKAINIFLMPLCVAIAGIVFAFYRKRRTWRK